MNTGERERVNRRLAAILAADVAGYSRLMGGDEEGTLERLKGHRRELVDPKIADDPDLKDLKTITLSYTFFRKDSSELEKAMEKFTSGQAG